MKIAIYTVDLFPGREHLMPWRVILEVAKYLNRKGAKTEIISIIKEKKNTPYCFQGVQIQPMENNLKQVVAYVNDHGFDHFFFQVKWRDGLRNFSDISAIKCKKTAYFDGGVYALRNALVLASAAGVRLARPYLLEALFPRSFIIQKLKKSGFNEVIGFTDLTTRAVRQAGFLNAQTIYPGRDRDTFAPSNNNVAKPYFLFTGSPHAARGSILLLKAFDRFADRVKGARIIFLMRKDVGSDFANFEKTRSRLRNRSRIEIVRENLDRQQLLQYFVEARAVILPFLTIPSEIPLTFFEVLSTGTPVITFENGGTTAYLSPGLAISKKMTAGSLAKKMEELWIDEDLRNTLSGRALALMDQHPGWEQSGEKWYQLLTAK